MPCVHFNILKFCENQLLAYSSASGLCWNRLLLSGSTLTDSTTATISIEQAQPTLSAALANNQRTYAAVARKGVVQPPPFALTLTYKPVPTRHRREILVVQGNKSNTQKNRSYKEIKEQLNRTGVAGEPVAIWPYSLSICRSIPPFPGGMCSTCRVLAHA